MNNPAPPQIAADHTDAKKLYAERERRIADAIALREPDRVPIAYTGVFFHARYAGISNRQAMYDHDALADAVRRVALDLQPDAVNTPFKSSTFGLVSEILGYSAFDWPGHGVPDDRPYQYRDKERMRADEYADFIEDPSWFLLTRFLPRVADAFAPFADFPQLAARTGLRVPYVARYFAEPGVAPAFARLAAAGEEIRKVTERGDAFQQELAELGFPLDSYAACHAPYDYFGDYLRGAKGIMLDLFRNKDKLLEAMEVVIPMIIRDVVKNAEGGPNNRVHITLHWGLDGFMSPDQFKTFYWPQLRKVMMGLIENGLVPYVFWEGNCDSRLETIADVPEGTCVYKFERSDLFRAKAVLGDLVCLRGNVPVSMLIGGTPEEVRDYSRKLIEVVGKGGGFILDASAAIPQEAKTENVFAMFQAAKEFGRYG
jgi:uroporphyrinogen-III decarboxylase